MLQTATRFVVAERRSADGSQPKHAFASLDKAIAVAEKLGVKVIRAYSEGRRESDLITKEANGRWMSGEEIRLESRERMEAAVERATRLRKELERRAGVGSRLQSEEQDRARDRQIVNGNEGREGRHSSALAALDSFLAMRGLSEAARAEFRELARKELEVRAVAGRSVRAVVVDSGAPRRMAPVTPLPEQTQEREREATMTR
jgi:Asp-tRNA(Asn)/Glu-tRNA(Gln) amidotransferase A subunit family amidase